jgi:hypothetical protein
VLNDRHAEAPLQGQQRELCREALHLADLDLLSRALRHEQVHVGMIAVVQLSTCSAVAARPRCWVRIQTQKTGRQVTRQARLADSLGSGKKKRVWRPATLDAAPDVLERSLMSAGSKLTHD